MASAIARYAGFPVSRMAGIQRCGFLAISVRDLFHVVWIRAALRVDGAVFFPIAPTSIKCNNSFPTAECVEWVVFEFLATKIVCAFKFVSC
jgi:hypothetical protein